MPGGTTGIGPALREARTSRGISLDEASRETKIRPSYLQAMEIEEFDALQGEVYVRGFLRSYSSYLGLDPDKVLTAYAGVDVPGTPVVRPPQPTRDERRGLRILHRRANYRLAVVLTSLLIVVFAAVGLFAGTDTSNPAQPPDPTLPAASEPALEPFVVAEVEATEPVHVVIIADGRPLFDGKLPAREPREFTATTQLRVKFDRGVVALTVNGHSLGVPGSPDHRYRASFTPKHFVETPSASG